MADQSQPRIIRVFVALLQLAGPLKFEFTDDENKSIALGFERVLRELNHRERCLLLLDNVSDPSILEPEYLDRLPRDGRVDLIATTRLAPRNIPGSAQAQTFIAVDELPEEDALALLRSHQPAGRFPNQEEDDLAREIVRLLEGVAQLLQAANRLAEVEPLLRRALETRWQPQFESVKCNHVEREPAFPHNS